MNFPPPLLICQIYQQQQFLLRLTFPTVVPLRCIREVRESESAGCAALHARLLFEGDRYAVGTSKSVMHGVHDLRLFQQIASNAIDAERLRRVFTPEHGNKEYPIPYNLSPMTYHPLTPFFPIALFFQFLYHPPACFYRFKTPVRQGGRT